MAAAGASRGWTDRFVALGTAALVLAVYVATLAPGLIAITDTPKFQFIGRILGTAHPPGYPLYVVLSHAFGHLPIGSLAYRINLMSAVCMAAACAVLYGCARLLDASRPVAAAAALAFAFGSAAWSVSTIAEVYTLNALLVALVLATMLAWLRSGRAVRFYRAVALVGVALGAHTTSVFLVPAVALSAGAAAPRFARRARTVAVSALLVLVGLTQYLFIVIRTRQGAWGEAPASNLTELAHVVAGSQYFGALMPGGIGPFLSSNLPLVLRTAVSEMTLAGVVLAALGLAALWRRFRPALVLLAAGLIPYVLFAATYTPADFEVYLVPAFMMSWLLAAAGAQAVVQATERRAGRGWAALTAGLLALVPAWQFARNVEARDLSHSRADMRFFDALFDRLPERSALLHEDFLIDRMVYYKVLGERATEGRDVLALAPAQRPAVERLWKDGYGVFAFPATARMMRLLDGAEFSRAPLDLAAESVPGYLDDLPRDAIVAIGVPARHLGRFAPGGSLPLDAIGYSGDLAGLVASVAVVGRRGGEATAAVDRVSARVRVDVPGRSASDRGMPPIEVRVDQVSASIEFGGREILRTGEGMAVAVWRRSQLSAFFSVPASTGVPPAPPTPYAVYPLAAFRQRLAVGPAPVDLTAATKTGSFIYTTDGGGSSRLVIYAGRRRPLAPTLLDCSARRWPTIDVKAFDGPQGPEGDLVAALRSDGLREDQLLLAMPHVYRVAIDSDSPGAIGVQVGLGGVPETTRARLTTGASASVYPVNVATHPTRVDDRTHSIQMANNHHSHLVGAGWSHVHADLVGPYRETSGREAELILPVNGPGPIRVGVQLLPLPLPGAPPASAPVGLRFNGLELPTIAALPLWRRYWWDVPAAAVRSGVNEVVLTVSDARIAVSDFLVERRD